MRTHTLLLTTLITSAVAVAALPSMTLEGPTPRQSLGWHIVQSPNGGPKASGNALLAVDDLSASDAWAVGMQPVTTGFQTTTLAENWNGTAWSIVPTPKIFQPTAQLNSISAIVTNVVWAAGYSDNPSCLCGKTIVELWNGQSWLRAASPNPGVADYVYGVAAPSANDVWAVGQEWTSQSTWVPLIIHYNGQRWSVVNTSRWQYAALYTIFAQSPSDIWALGSVGLGNAPVLALHYNGVSWQRAAFPSDQGGYDIIRGLSGVATNDIWAGGFLVYNSQSDYLARAFHWDGAMWKQIDVSNLSQPSYFTAIHAIFSNDVWAVGQGVVLPNINNVQNITYHYDGTGWKNVANPDNLEGGTFAGVWGSTSYDVWAVGQGGTQTPPPGTLTMHFSP